MVMTAMIAEDKDTKYCILVFVRPISGKKFKDFSMTFQDFTLKFHEISYLSECQLHILFHS